MPRAARFRRWISAGIAEALGAHVVHADPFEVEATQKRLLALLDKSGVNVLILKQAVRIEPGKKGPQTVRCERGRNRLPGRELRLQQAVHPRLQMPRAQMGSGKQNRPHRRGHLFGLRRVCIHLPVRGHSQKGDRVK